MAAAHQARERAVAGGADEALAHETRTDATGRLLAAAGIAVIVLDALITGVMGALRDGYSHARQFISELAASGTSGAAVMTVWFVGWGLLMSAFAAGLYRGLPRTRGSWAGPALLVVAAVVGGIGTATFACDSGCVGRSVSQSMHEVLGVIGTSALALAPLAVWLSTRNDERWRDLQTLLLGLALLVGTMAILFGYSAATRDPASPNGLTGAFQRLFGAAFYIWLAVVAVRLLRARPTRPADAA